MNRKKIIVSLFLMSILMLSLSLSQNLQVDGKVVDKAKGAVMFGAHVRLVNQTDSTVSYVTSTDSSGKFSFSNPKQGAYTIEVTYLGYDLLKKSVAVNSSPVKLGTLSLTEHPIAIKGMTISEESPRAVQKHDTTEYGAQAYKVNKDATVEDLVTKMPGVTVENGTVTAQGENVQQVLVDGKQFFGNDPTVALRNLPAEIIDKIQVFDKMSDQAQFTGFDDGRSVKTMNIVTRRDRRQGQFGRFSAGYGTDDRYVATATMNDFDSDMRLSILGLSNNVNQQNFSTQDILGTLNGGGGPQRGGFGGGGGSGGGRGRRPGGGGGGGFGGGQAGGGNFGGGQLNNFFIGQQSGISTVHSLGTNYSDSLSHNFFMNGSYFFNLTDNKNPQTLDRQYTLTGDSSSTYNQNSNAEQKNYNNRINLRLDYAFDSSNSIVATPQISFQNTNTTSSLTGANTSTLDSLLSTTNNQNGTTTNGFSSSSDLVYRHRFETPGRTLSIDFGLTGNRRQNNGTLNSTDIFYTAQGTTIDTVNQQSNTLTKGYTLSSSLAYTEPITSNMQVLFNYTPSYTRNNSNKTTYNYNAGASSYDLLDTALSNTYENTYSIQNGGVSLRFRNDDFNMAVGTSYQVSDLRNNQTYPYISTLSKTFYSVLPNMMLNYTFSQHSNLHVFYRTSTASPSVTQLQSVVDNTNPLFLTSGNQDLRQSYAQTLLSRFLFSNEENTQTTMLFFTFGVTQNYIANSTIIAQTDTVVQHNVHLTQGTQLTTPVNLDGYWTTRLFLTHGIPIGLFKSNLNINAGITYSRTPGLLDGVNNLSSNAVFSPGFVLGSNISENVDFTLSYSANFNNTKNSNESELNNSYFSQTAGVKFTWEFWNGFVLRNEVNNTLYNGLSSTLNQNYFIWNINIGKKFFADERGEVTLSVADLLNQNKSITRTVTETYIEDAQTQPLKRYFLLTFTYNLRQFGGSTTRGGNF